MIVDFIFEESAILTGLLGSGFPFMNSVVLESARRPLFEPPRAGCQETRVRWARAQHYL